MSAVALTYNEYGAKNGKKMLREVVVKFRDYFAGIDPGMYLDVFADKEDYD